MANSERRLVSFNDAYCRMFGFSPKQLRTALLSDLVCEEDRERFAGLYSQLLSGEAKSIRFVGRRLTVEGPRILVGTQAWGVRENRSRKPE